MATQGISSARPGKELQVEVCELSGWGGARLHRPPDAVDWVRTQSRGTTKLAQPLETHNQHRGPSPQKYMHRAAVARKHHLYLFSGRFDVFRWMSRDSAGTSTLPPSPQRPGGGGSGYSTGSIIRRISPPTAVSVPHRICSYLDRCLSCSCSPAESQQNLPRRHVVQLLLRTRLGAPSLLIFGYSSSGGSSSSINRTNVMRISVVSLPLSTSLMK